MRKVTNAIDADSSSQKTIWLVVKQRTSNVGAVI